MLRRNLTLFRQRRFECLNAGFQIDIHRKFCAVGASDIHLHSLSAARFAYLISSPHPCRRPNESKNFENKLDNKKADRSNLRNPNSPIKNIYIVVYKLINRNRITEREKNKSEICMHEGIACVCERKRERESLVSSKTQPT